MPTMIWTWIWYRDAVPMQTFTADAANQSAPQVNFNN
jgi:LemA protein